MAINDRVIQVKQALIKDVCSTINAHIKIQKNDYLNDGKFPIIDQSSNPIAGYTDVEKAVIDNGEYVIFGDHTRIIKFVDFPFAQGADGIKIIKACSYVQPKFLYYSLCNLTIPNKGYSRHWGLVSNLNINIPSVNVQEEIVKILDSFTNLIDALNEELSLRQKQFEYYREKLLAFDDVEPNIMNDIINDLRTGLNPRTHFKLNTEDANCYYVTVRELGLFDIVIDEKTDKVNRLAIDRINERSKIKNNDILFSGTGTIGRTALVKSEMYKWNIKEGVYVITPNILKVNPRYLIYLLHSLSLQKQYEIKAEGGAVKSVSMKEFKSLIVHIPSLAIQQSIVEKLDAFESLISSLKEEIALRQKQYEYYREKLLNFD